MIDNKTNSLFHSSLLRSLTSLWLTPWSTAETRTLISFDLKRPSVLATSQSTIFDVLISKTWPSNMLQTCLMVEMLRVSLPFKSTSSLMEKFWCVFSWLAGVIASIHHRQSCWLKLRMHLSNFLYPYPTQSICWYWAQMQYQCRT